MDESELNGHPIHLVMRGEFEAAIQLYLDMYAVASRQGDQYISTDLCAQFLYCVGAVEGKRPEDAEANVIQLIREAMSERGLGLNEPKLRLQLRDALSEIRVGRRRAEAQLSEVNERD